MATMRSGLETWLKQECVGIGDSYQLAGNYALLAHLSLMDDNPLVALQYAENLQNQLDTLKPVPFTGGDIEDIRRLMTSIMVGLDSPDIFEVNTQVRIDVLDNLEKISQIIQKETLEKVVECQCGKQQEPMNMETLKTMARNVGTGIAYEKMHTTYMNQNISTEPKRSDYPDTPQGDADYYEAFTKWYRNKYPRSTMGAILINTETANNEPCHCTEDKRFCWHPGYIGMLSKEQRGKLCTEGNWKKLD